MLSNEAAQTLRVLIQDKALAGESWDIAYELNTPRDLGDFTTRIVPRRTVKSLLMERGKFNSLMSSTNPVAQQIKYILHDPDYPEIEVFDPLAQMILNAAVQAGELTEDDKAALEAKGRVPVLRSWAQQALGMDVSQADVEQVLELTPSGG